MNTNWITDGIVSLAKSKFESEGYQWFDGNAPYNLNLFGVRSSTRKVNEFDDFIYAIYRDNNLNWKIHQWPATTDPGLPQLLNPSNHKGVAILVPGQYKSTYKIDLHSNKYPALCQRLSTVKVYRDSNRNNLHDLDPSTIDEGFFGINIHKAGIDSVRVDNWSAGCQVFKREEDFNQFMDLCKRSAQIYGNSFTYTLFQA